MLVVGATAVESLRAGVGVAVGGAAGVPMRQTLLAAMQVLPQGMPLRQFFWASAATGNAIRAATASISKRFITPPRTWRSRLRRRLVPLTMRTHGCLLLHPLGTV